MENLTQIGKGKEFNSFSLNDKHYFGSFLNLADNNIKDVILEFKSRLNITKGTVEGIKDYKNVIAEYFTDNSSIVDWERGIRILTEYLPIIKFLDLSIEEKQFNKSEKKRRAYFRNNLFHLLDAIEELRNFYTHYYHNEIIFKGYDSNLFSFLDDVLLKTAIDVKRNYLKDDKTREILKDTLAEQIDLLIDIKRKKYQEEKKLDSSIKIPNNENLKNAVFNDAFNRLLFSKDLGDNKKETQLRDFSKTSINKYNVHGNQDFNIPISTSGIVFLLSMFLSKREIEDLKSNIKGFKGKVVKDDLEKNNSLLFMATHKVYSILAFKGLKFRVKTSEFDKETLLMQMIDELSKVPHSIYKVLSDTKQKEFIEDINEYYKDNEENEENLENSLVVHPVIRKRYEDKFNYFAIRYLDEFANFPTLKFQVYLGNYIHDNRQKKIGSTLTATERLIKEKINVFGNLSKAGNFKTDFFDKLGENETQWEFFPNPSYNFVGNNIPIHLELLDNRMKEEKEKVTALIHKEEDRGKRKGNKPTKSELVKEITESSKDFKQGDPTAILSLNELPALLYELLVNKKSGKDIEKIILSKITEQFDKIKNADSSQFLSKDQYPKNLSRAKSFPTIDFIKLKRDIRKEVEITNEKLVIIKGNKEEAYKHSKVREHEKAKYRKYVFFTSEKGIEATWIANDLKRFMPQKVREEWKGFQHSELQRTLAFYEFNKKEALSLLSVWNFDSDEIGEEIIKCFKKEKFEDFYEAYLVNRKAILKLKLQQIDNAADDSKVIKIITKECFRYFHQQNYTIQPLDVQVKRLLAKPTHLPKGIFDAKPTRIEGVIFKENKKMFADWFVYANEEKHEYQSFYDNAIYDRNYRTLYADKSIYDNSKKLTPAKQFSNFEKRQEGEIRKQKMRDVFTKLIVDDLFERTFNEQIPLSLAELFQTKDERLQNQILADTQKDRQKGDNSENVRNLNFIWNKEVALKLHSGSTTIENVKLKEVGKFRKYERDTRVATFIQYEPNINWNVYLDSNWKLKNKTKPINVFQIQIEEYEQVRSEELFKLIHSFEKEIFENIEDKSILLENGYPNFKRYIVNGYLKIIKGINSDDLKLFDKNLNQTVFENILSCSEIIQKAYLLIMTRNKFAHNQLPSKQLYDLSNGFLKKEENDSYAKYFLKLTEKLLFDMKN